MVAMVRYSSQAGCQAQHAIGSPTVCYLCLSRFLSPLYVSIPLFVRLSFTASYSPLRPTRFHPRSYPALRRCRARLPRDPRDGEPADIFDSWAKEKFFARGRSLVGGRKEESRARLPAKEAALPLFNLQSFRYSRTRQNFSSRRGNLRLCMRRSEVAAESHVIACPLHRDIK